MRSLVACFVFSSLLLAAPKAMISTNLGEMIFELDDKTTPKTTAQFIRQAKVAAIKAKAFIG